MLTVFGAPKSFEGEYGIFQENAVQSWTRLGQDIEIILFGKDPGVADFCKRIGVRNEADIEYAPSGAPMLASVIARAEALARNEMLCLVNTDIILLGDILEAVKRLSFMKEYLLTGSRYEMCVSGRIDILAENWESRLLTRKHERTEIKGVDYWVFRKGIYNDIPPLIIGRNYWDYWLIYRALSQHIPVIDGTRAIRAIHQTHEIKNRKLPVDEVRWNRKMSGVGQYFTIDDATHVLTGEGLVMSSDDWRLIDSLLMMKLERVYPYISLARYRRDRASLQDLLKVPLRMICKRLV